MAPRRGAVESPEPEPSTSLTFNEPLSWRAGKPIATATLLDRLKRLASELREMDQDEVDRLSLNNVAKELAAQNLLNHKDNGVKALTACCLVDILKLCAPDAPFTPTQVKNIFTLFVSNILPALSNPGHGYNTEHKYVLSSLAEVQSIVLLTDVPNADDLMLHLFTSFFDITSGASKSSTGEQISKDVEYNMTQALATLIDETQNIPTQVIDIIVAQFLRAATPGGEKVKGSKADDKQSTLLLKDLPEAYNMAKTICNECSEKMSRYVSQYFNEVMMAMGGSETNGHRRTSDGMDSDDEDEGHTGPTDIDLKELQKAHRLLRELWRASPSVLQNVIPQVEAELSVENVELRRLATATLGDIISGIGAAGPPPPPNMDPAAYPPFRLDEYVEPEPISILTKPSSPQSFALTHPAVYHSFLSRKNDKSAIIRATWTTAVGRILVTSAGGIGLNREDEDALVKSLAVKLYDADEKVRIAAVKAVAGFNLPDIMAKFAPNGPVTKSGSVLCNLADRARDRKPAVRAEAMRTLGTIWGVAVGEIAAGNESVIATLGAIPSRIFEAFFANDLELNVLLDHVTFEQLLPLTYPPSKAKGSKSLNGASQSQLVGDGPFDADKIRAERVLLLVRSLDGKAKKAFFAMQARQKTYSEILTIYVKKCEEFNGGVMDDNAADIKQKLNATIDYLIKFLPEPLRTSQELHKYAKMHDRRTYQLLRYAMDPKSEFKTVHNAIKEFSKRIEAAPSAPAGLLDTMIPLIYRSAFLVYNRSNLPAILSYSRTDDKGLGATAHEVMNEISEKSPQVLTANIKELCKTIEDEAPSESKANDPGAVATLKACAVFAKSKTESKSLPKDRKFVQTLISYALYGTPPRAAKYAVTLLMVASERKEMHVKDLLEKTTKDWKYGGDHFLTKLAALSQLQLLSPKAADDFNDEILAITTQEILLQVRTPAQETDRGWQADDELDEECQAKCWALKILVNRLRGTEDAEEAKTVAQPVYKLLNTLIANNGELSKKKESPKHHKSRLRLLAAQLMLKLCTNQMFDDLLTPLQFDRLALVTQDEHPNVRKGFVEKLQKYLVKDKLSDRFYTIIFLTAHEPEPNFRNSIVTWIRSRAKVFADTKSTVLEKIFPRLLSLLAHHPDYSPGLDELKDHAAYILYYVSNIASEDNLGLIFKYAQSVKQARDALHPTESDNLYVLSDLSQLVIQKWEQKKGWTMQTYPAKVRVPAKLFSALPSHDVAQKIAETNYVDEEMDDLLDKLLRDQDKKKSHKRKSVGDESSLPAAKKQKSESSRSHRAAGPKKPKVAKTPKPKKVKEPRTPADSGERRKSGRDRSVRKSYIDRDDSEDDKEMWNGVKSWEYYDDKGVLQQVESEEEESGEEEQSEEEEEDEEAASKSTTKTPKQKEQAVEVVDEDVEMADEEEPTPPPKRNSRTKRTPAKKVVPEPEPEEAIPEPEEEPEKASSPPKRNARAARGKKQVSSKKVDPESEPEQEDEQTAEKEVTPEPEPEPELDQEKEDTPEPTPPTRSARSARGKRLSTKKVEPEPEPEPEEKEDTPEPEPEQEQQQEDIDMLYEKQEDIEMMYQYAVPEQEEEEEVAVKPPPAKQANGKGAKNPKTRGGRKVATPVVKKTKVLEKTKIVDRSALKPSPGARNTRGRGRGEKEKEVEVEVEIEKEVEKEVETPKENVVGRTRRTRGVR